MKKLLTLLALAFFAVALPVSQTGCAAPSQRVVQVQTLKAVGHTAEAAVATSAQLYAAHQITDKQALDVIDFFNLKFQPAYRVAVNAVNANLDSIASPELASLATQLALLVASYQKPSSALWDIPRDNMIVFTPEMQRRNDEILHHSNLIFP